MSTPITRYAGTTNEEAASPPLSPRMCHAGYAAAPPASRVLRIADATGLRPALDPGASTTPWCSQTRAGTGPAPVGARPIQDQKPQDHYIGSLYSFRGLPPRSSVSLYLPSRHALRYSQ